MGSSVKIRANPWPVLRDRRGKFPHNTGSMRSGKLIVEALAAVVWALAATAAAQVPASTVMQRLGYPADAKLLIIHADDLGMAHSVNRATFEALQKGWVTSASVMVPCPWFPEAADFAREHPQFDIGLHLTLTSEWKAYRWRPVSAKPLPTLLDKQGYLPHSAAAFAAQADPREASEEIRAQVEKARQAGINFTHLDSHMGALFEKPELYEVYQQVAHDYHVPNLLAEKGSPHGKLHGRHGLEVAVDTLVVSKDIQMRPYHSRKKWLKVYEQMLKPLPAGGIYQLIVHLGYDDAELEAIAAGHPHWGARWRQSDLDVVSSSEFQKFLRDSGFTLVTWRDLARALSGDEASGPAQKPS